MPFQKISFTYSSTAGILLNVIPIESTVDFDIAINFTTYSIIRRRKKNQSASVMQRTAVTSYTDDQLDIGSEAGEPFVYFLPPHSPNRCIFVFVRICSFWRGVSFTFASSKIKRRIRDKIEPDYVPFLSIFVFKYFEPKLSVQNWIGTFELVVARAFVF